MHTISYAEGMQSVRETQSNIKKVVVNIQEEFQLGLFRNSKNQSLFSDRVSLLFPYKHSYTGLYLFLIDSSILLKYTFSRFSNCLTPSMMES